MAFNTDPTAEFSLLDFFLLFSSAYINIITAALDAHKLLHSALLIAAISFMFLFCLYFPETVKKKHAIESSAGTPCNCFHVTQQRALGEP